MRKLPGRLSRPGDGGLDLVGIVEVADRLGVERATVDKWRQRRIMPDAEWVVSGTPIWRWSTIRRWAEATGRTA